MINKSILPIHQDIKYKYVLSKQSNNKTSKFNRLTSIVSFKLFTSLLTLFKLFIILYIVRNTYSILKYLEEGESILRIFGAEFGILENLLHKFFFLILFVLLEQTIINIHPRTKVGSIMKIYTVLNFVMDMLMINHFIINIPDNIFGSTTDYLSILKYKFHSYLNNISPSIIANSDDNQIFNFLILFKSISIFLLLFDHEEDNKAQKAFIRGSIVLLILEHCLIQPGFMVKVIKKTTSQFLFNKLVSTLVGAAYDKDLQELGWSAGLENACLNIVLFVIFLMFITPEDRMTRILLPVLFHLHHISKEEVYYTNIVNLNSRLNNTTTLKRAESLVDRNMGSMFENTLSTILSLMMDFTILDVDFAVDVNLICLLEQTTLKNIARQELELKEHKLMSKIKDNKERKIIEQYDQTFVIFMLFIKHMITMCLSIFFYNDEKRFDSLVYLIIDRCMYFVAYSKLSFILIVIREITRLIFTLFFLHKYDNKIDLYKTTKSTHVLNQKEKHMKTFFRYFYDKYRYSTKV